MFCLDANAECVNGEPEDMVAINLSNNAPPCIRTADNEVHIDKDSHITGYVGDTGLGYQMLPSRLQGHTNVCYYKADCRS
jgi:hypothetical protein